MVSTIETAAAATALRGGSGSETSFSSLKASSVDSRAALGESECPRKRGDILSCLEHPSQFDSKREYSRRSQLICLSKSKCGIEVKPSQCLWETILSKLKQIPVSGAMGPGSLVPIHYLTPTHQKAGFGVNGWVRDYLW
jgi:hypothetical protein